MPLGFIDTGTLVRHSKNIMAAQISCCFCAVVVASKHITAGKSRWKSSEKFMAIIYNGKLIFLEGNMKSKYNKNTQCGVYEAWQWLLCAYMGNYYGACTSCMQHVIGGRRAQNKRTIKQESIPKSKSLRKRKTQATNWTASWISWRKCTCSLEKRSR